MSDLQAHASEQEPGEGEALAATARRWRTADRRLAATLGRPPPTNGAASAAYLAELTDRRPLPPELERRLVAAAQAGDARARAQLVEAFMSLIASVARTYGTRPGSIASN